MEDMILEYLWIQNFRVLKDKGFNFSSQRRFNFNQESKTLTIIENPRYIPNFFGSQISDVTALIGENGVGKSTLLEFIFRNLAGHGDGSSQLYEDGEYVAVFSNLILVPKNSFVKNQTELEKKGYRFEEYTAPNLVYRLSGNNYQNLSYIYYSNVFDYHIDYGQPPNLIDLSTNFLLSDESRSSDGQIKLYDFVFKEIKRQIDFLAEIDYKVPFKLPKSIYIEIEKEVRKNRIIISDDDLTKKEVHEILLVQRELNSRSPHDNLKYQIYLNILKYRSFSNPSIYKDLKSETIFLIFQSNFKLPSSLNSQLKMEFLQIKEVFESYDLLLRAERLSIEPKMDYTIKYKLLEDNKLFYDLLNRINKLMNQDTFIRYSWHSLSSGEKAFLAVLSRLNQGRKIIDEKFELEIKHIVLLIDEFDLYMHPEWQREFFYIIHSVLPLIFKGKKVQLIISSHSPFLISDLPKSNVILFNKKGIGIENTSSIKSLEKIEETFGQNIHTLFTDSFFLKKGLLGEFASNKINDLICFINGENSSLKNDEDAQKIIDIIGEPIVKNKLQLMLNEKRTDEEKIKWHESQLKLLRSKQNKN